MEKRSGVSLQGKCEIMLAAITQNGMLTGGGHSPLHIMTILACIAPT